MKQLIFRLPIVLSAAVALALFATTAPTLAQTGERCFPETNQCMRGRFHQYWEQHGGLSVFGLPITPQAPEVNRDTGQTYETQWLERNRFELHPENQAPYDVLLGRLGDDRLRQLGIEWQTLPKANPSDPHYFAETGHAITHEPFWQYWRSHGLELGDRGNSERESLALFGYPISPTRMETNASGDTVLTQWFERARFEWHPNNPDPYKVLLGLLGTEARTLVAVKQNPGLPGHLLILSDTLYDVQADGSRVMPLPYNSLSGGLIVSPNGNKVAFRCTANGGTGICTANYDGSNLARINDDSSATVAAWSPDSSRIAYISGLGERRGLHVINADGSGDLLLFAATPSRMVSSPSWSPDGRRLVFNTIYSETALYVVNADGSQLAQIAPHGAFAQWSPQGDRIVFESAISGNQDIYVINPDGTGRMQLTDSLDSESIPVWSPDGTHIAYRWEATVEPNPAGAPSGIYVMDANGGNKVRALYTEPTYRFGSAVWSPDGIYVAAARFCPRLCGPGQTLGARADGSADQFVMVESKQLGALAAIITWLP